MAHKEKKLITTYIFLFSVIISQAASVAEGKGDFFNILYAYVFKMMIVTRAKLGKIRQWAKRDYLLGILFLGESCV